MTLVICCSSFDHRGIGDVFSARVASNFVNEDILGSLEFASKAAGSKVIVALGHSSCGAIKRACDDVVLGNLTGMLNLPRYTPLLCPSAVARRGNSAHQSGSVKGISFVLKCLSSMGIGVIGLKVDFWRY